MNRWTCTHCQHRWASDSPAAYWCPSCGAPKVYPQPPFIALEGIDGCGKGVQSRRLAEDLRGVRFSFPDYNTPIGGLVGAHLRREWAAHRLDCGDDSNVKYHDEALIFQALQSANRLEWAHKIATHLAEGCPVVADRYYASGLVYGSADGIAFEYLERLHRYLPQPTHWILIDIDVETSMERRPEGRDRYEADAEFMREVCLRYRQLWIRNKWPIVDGRGSVDDVASQIHEVVMA